MAFILEAKRKNTQSVADTIGCYRCSYMKNKLTVYFAPKYGLLFWA